MAKLKYIWKNTFLGRMLDTDPVMGRVLSLVIVIYLCVHIFRLETYPFYMFAMFSKKEVPRELYHTYTFYNKHQKINLDHWDYRKYTVFMNTVSQYDDILQNDMTHPESKVIDKFMNRLHLENTLFKTNLKGKFTFSKEDLEPKVVAWLSEKLEISPQNLRITRENYRWIKPSPRIHTKFQLYGTY